MILRWRAWGRDKWGVVLSAVVEVHPSSGIALPPRGVAMGRRWRGYA